MGQKGEWAFEMVATMGTSRDPREFGPQHTHKTGFSDWWTQPAGVSAPAKPTDVLPEISGSRTALIRVGWGWARGP